MEWQIKGLLGTTKPSQGERDPRGAIEKEGKSENREKSSLFRRAALATGRRKEVRGSCPWRDREEGKEIKMPAFGESIRFQG